MSNLSCQNVSARSVRKVSSHIEYLNLIAQFQLKTDQEKIYCAWMNTLPLGYSVGSETPLNALLLHSQTSRVSLTSCAGLFCFLFFKDNVSSPRFLGKNHPLSHCNPQSNFDSLQSPLKYHEQEEIKQNHHLTNLWILLTVFKN